MEPIKAVADKILPQSLDGKIGVYNAHDAADKEKQNQYLYAVIDEEVDGTTQGGSAVQSYQGIYKPIGKLLYHILFLVSVFVQLLAVSCFKVE